MLARLQIPFMTTAQREAIIPNDKDLILDIDLYQIFVGDGVTAGGVPASSPGIFEGTLDDIAEGTTNKHFTATEKTKLSGIESGAVALSTVKSDSDISSAISLKHSHSNKSILDSIQEALTTALKSDYDTAYSHSQSAHAPSNAEANVQSDWDQTDNEADDYIKNKPTIPTQYTDEMAQDAVGNNVDSNTLSYNDTTGAISVKTQMSVTSDSNGLKLSGDSSSPGNNKVYGTDGSGNKGWKDDPSGGGGLTQAQVLIRSLGC